MVLLEADLNLKFPQCAFTVTGLGEHHNTYDIQIHFLRKQS